MHDICRSPANSTMGHMVQGGEQEIWMRHVKHFLQHRFNPLHVYCRLRDVGLSPRTAGRVSGLYERYVYRVCCPQ
ncbi:MAG TPA: hypothetical protein VE028_12955 [Nitratidesulfovibrio sp.]|nr:hypothetical protein [Nitratidesulfovibrio sp.]